MMLEEAMRGEGLRQAAGLRRGSDCLSSSAAIFRVSPGMRIHVSSRVETYTTIIACFAVSHHRIGITLNDMHYRVYLALLVIYQGRQDP